MGGFKDMFTGLGQSAERRAISRSLALFAKGDLAKAIEVLKEAHTRSPEDIEILFELTPMLARAGRDQESGEALRKILRRDPNALPRVMEMIEQARAKRAKVSALHDALAEHFIRRNDLEHAIESLGRAGAEDLKALMGRHRSRWESVRKGAPDAKMTKPSLHSAYYLALSHEHLREFASAADIYRTVARNNPEELERILKRLQILLNKDYQNSALRVAVADLYLQAGREDEAAQQMRTALETDPANAPAITECLDAYLVDKQDRVALLWVLALAHRSCGSVEPCLAAMRSLVEAGAHLEEVTQLLQEMASRDDGKPARRLLAHAQIRQKQYQAALESLMQVSEEDGLVSIREPLEILAEAQPKVSRTHMLLADIHLAEDRHPEAAACLRRARDAAPGEDSLLITKVTGILEKHSTSADAHLLLADMQLAAGEKERTVVVLRHLVREAPGGASDALDRLTAILESGNPSPRARIGAAEACLVLQQHQQALVHLNHVASGHPDLTAEFLHVIGLLAEAAPDQYSGLGDLLRKLEPRSPLPHAVRFALGDAAFHGDDPVTSTAAFRDVLEAAPERSEEIRQALDRFDRADTRAAEVPYLLALIHLDRSDHEAALTELLHGRGVNVALLERILSRYEQVISALPDDAAARCGYVQALLLGRQFDKVLAVGEETLTRINDPRVGRVMLLMGDALREKGDRDNAAKRYFAAYGRDRTLATEAADRLQLLVQDEGTHSLASLALGKMMASEGRSTEAREALCAAGEADPKLRDTVLTELRGLMASCPGDPETGLVTIGLMLEVRDMHQALEVATSLLDQHPEHASHLAGHLETIVNERPDDAKAHFQFGRVLQLLGFHARSSGVLLNAFRRDNTLGPAIQQRLQESLKDAPSIAEPYLASSAIHASRAKYQAAADVLSRALESSPALAVRLLPRLEEIWKQTRGNGRIALTFAETCLKAEQHEKAAEAYGEAAENDADLHAPALKGLDAIVVASPDLAVAFLQRAKVHAQRLRLDAARSDLDRAFRLAPELLSEILSVAEELHAGAPDTAPGTLLLADLYIAARRETDATRLLLAESERERTDVERLTIVVRLWRLALARRDDEAAREHLAEATRLAPDRNQFLARVHQVQVAALNNEATTLRKKVEDGSRRSSDLERALRALIELGRIDEASVELERNADIFPPEIALRLRAELALRRGDYPRAFENLKSLGPSAMLAFGAERAGDHALAVQTLESLSARGDEPALRISLERVYRSMVSADLMGGSRRLQGETIVSFGEETAK